MTKRYTAADFANARFAEHPDGRIAARLQTEEARPWESVRDFHADEGMAADGWVPVPTKPTITESETIREEEAHGTNFWLGFRKGFERAGGQIIPDPPPTNLEKLLRIIGGFEVFDAEGREAAHQIAQILDNNNVIVKDN